jgi:hypothetical protein
MSILESKEYATLPDGDAMRSPRVRALRTMTSTKLLAAVLMGLSTSIKTPTCQQSNTGRTLSLANGRVRPLADIERQAIEPFQN